MKLLLLTAALLGVACASLLRDFKDNRSVGPAYVGGAVSGGRATGHTVNQFVLNVRELTAFDRSLNGADDEDEDLGPFSLDQGPISVDLDTDSQTDDADFERAGRNNVGPATVGGAVSGDRASGHNLNQFIVNVQRLRSNRALTNDYIRRLARRIVDQANRNRPFSLDIEENKARSAGHTIRQFTRNIDRLTV